MKNLFPGHFKESDESLREVWETSLFVFDANILLNLYRYSDATRNEFLRILTKLKDRTWLPHRAAEEYLNNRLTVIDQQETSYDETVKLIEKLQLDLDNARQHPFVGKEVMEKANVVFVELCDELKRNKSIHTNRISSDDIKDSIAKIFGNSVGLPYDKNQLEVLISDGEERYKQRIPPGFKDGAKAGDSEVFSEKCRKYGDLIVWSQAIDKAIEMNKGVVLVTDDKKEDWWEKFKGKTVGPRPELVKEFKDRANQTFHMYQADRFLELAREILGERVSEEIVEEIREVRRRDRLEHRRMKEIEFSRHKKMQLVQELESARHQMVTYEQELLILEEKRHLLENEKASLKEFRNKMLREGSNEYVNDNYSANQFYHISKNLDDALHRLHESQIKYHELRQYMAALEKELSLSIKIIEQEDSADS